MPSSLDYNRIAAVAYSVRRFPDFIPEVGTISTFSTTLSFLPRATCCKRGTRTRKTWSLSPFFSRTIFHCRSHW